MLPRAADASPSVSVVVLTRNEAHWVEANLLSIVAHARERFADVEVVVSDFSEDETPAIVERVARAVPGVRLVRAPRRGIGAGIKAGFEAARKDVVIAFPIDLSWDLDTIDRSVAAIVEGTDVVIGSRWCPGASTERPLVRNVLSRGYNLLVRALFGLRVADTQGTVALRRRDLATFLAELESDDPFLETEILILARERGLAIGEIPCRVVERRGHSNVSPVREGRKMLVRMLGYWYARRARRRAAHASP